MKTENEIKEGRDTPKFVNKNMTYDFCPNTHQNISDVDLMSIKSEVNNPIDNQSNFSRFNVTQNIISTNPNTEKADLNYIFDFKDNCNLEIINKNEDFKPSLSFYQTTFDNYLKDTEELLKIKYKNDRKKLMNIPFKIHKLKVKMIIKLITEIFVDDRELILNNKFGKDFNDKPIKKKICYVVRLAIPEEDSLYFNKLLWAKINNSNGSKAENSLSQYSDVQNENEELLSMYMDQKNIKTIEKLEPNLLSKFLAKSYSDEDYRNILENAFFDVNYYNGRLFKIFKEVIAKLNFDFMTFIKTFCIFLRFSEQLNTKIKILGKEVLIEIFTDDNTLLKKAEEVRYSFQMSNYGKRKLCDFKSRYFNTYTTGTGNKYDKEPCNLEDSKFSEDLQLNEELYTYYTRNISLPYTEHSMSLFKLYDNQKDTKIKEEFNVLFDSNSMSILRNMDRIRILELMINSCLNLKNFKKAEFVVEFTVKRDTTIYNQKSANFVWSHLNIFSEKEIGKNLKRFRHAYGEHLSYYFFWTFHLLTWVCYFVFLLMLLFCVKYFVFTSNITHINFYGIPVQQTIDFSYSIFFIMWLTLYNRSWKENEKTLAIRWGTFNEGNLLEKDREEYECNDYIQIFSNRIPRHGTLKIFISYGTSFLFTLFMIFFTVSSLIYIVEFQMIDKTNKNDLNALFMSLNKKKTDPTKDIPMPNLAFLVGFYIKFMSKVFEYICVKLTQNENHQKASSYKRSYIFKSLVFNIFNNYFTFYYITFFKSHAKRCPTKSCYYFLLNQLQKIFLSYLIITLVELIIPFFINYFKRVKFFKIISENHQDMDSNELKKIKSNIHKKYNFMLLPKYNGHDLTQEYLNTIYLLGFLTQFGIVFPFLFFFLFAFYIFVRRLIDAHKMVYFYNINLFHPTEGIGFFSTVVKFFFIISTFCNLYIAFFTRDIDEKILSKGEHWYGFVILRNCFLVCMFLMNLEYLPSWRRYYKAIKEDFIIMRNLYVKDKHYLVDKINQSNIEKIGNKSQYGPQSNQISHIQSKMGKTINNSKDAVIIEVKNEND